MLGVLLEYGLLVDMALMATSALADLGVAVQARIDLATSTLTQPTVPDHDVPLVEQPENQPRRTPLTTPTRKPPRQPNCASWLLPNDIVPAPLTTYDGQRAAHGVTGLLHGFEPGDLPEVEPVGWQTQDTEPPLDRGHLLGSQFGGGGDIDNIVTMFRAFNNNRRDERLGMNNAEDAVRDALLACRDVTFAIFAEYWPDQLPAEQLWAETPPRLPVEYVDYFAVSDGATVFSNILYNEP